MNFYQKDRKVTVLNISAPVLVPILIFLCKEFPEGQKYVTVSD